jgi:hypothetical protein
MYSGSADTEKRLPAPLARAPPPRRRSLAGQTRWGDATALMLRRGIIEPKAQERLAQLWIWRDEKQDGPVPPPPRPPPPPRSEPTASAHSQPALQAPPSPPPAMLSAAFVADSAEIARTNADECGRTDAVSPLRRLSRSGSGSGSGGMAAAAAAAEAARRSSNFHYEGAPQGAGAAEEEVPWWAAEESAEDAAAAARVAASIARHRAAAAAAAVETQGAAAGAKPRRLSVSVSGVGGSRRGSIVVVKGDTPRPCDAVGFAAVDGDAAAARVRATLNGISCGGSGASSSESSAVTGAGAGAPAGGGAAAAGAAAAGATAAAGAAAAEAVPAEAVTKQQLMPPPLSGMRVHTPARSVERIVGRRESGEDWTTMAAAAAAAVAAGGGGNGGNGGNGGSGDGGSTNPADHLAVLIAGDSAEGGSANVGVGGGGGGRARSNSRELLLHATEELARISASAAKQNEQHSDSSSDGEERDLFDDNDGGGGGGGGGGIGADSSVGGLAPSALDTELRTARQRATSRSGAHSADGQAAKEREHMAWMLQVTYANLLAMISSSSFY